MRRLCEKPIMTLDTIDDTDAGMSLRSVNLNLLPILRALLATASVTRAAASLGLSQSAMSDALARLRATLDDPLLVRVGSGMTLTPRAAALREPVERLCADLEQFFVRPSFDSATTTREFVIATADHGTFLVAKTWLARLAEQAPRARLRFATIDQTLPDRLADGDFDFAIVPAVFLDALAPAPLASKPLESDSAVALFRKGHALDRGEPLGHEELARQRLILFHPGVAAIERRHGDFFSGGAHFEPIAVVPQVTLLPYLLLDSDEVAIVPGELARRMSVILALAQAPLAFAPQRLELVLVWSLVQDADAGNRWFRHQIATREELQKG